MVINMEWGSYISDLLPMTADDHASDTTGANPGKCFFEKLISGMFMGEAVSNFPPPTQLLKPCGQHAQAPKVLVTTSAFPGRMNS